MIANSGFNTLKGVQWACYEIRNKERKSTNQPERNELSKLFCVLSSIAAYVWHFKLHLNLFQLRRMRSSRKSTPANPINTYIPNERGLYQNK